MTPRAMSLDQNLVPCIRDYKNKERRGRQRKDVGEGKKADMQVSSCAIDKPSTFSLRNEARPAGPEVSPACPGQVLAFAPSQQGLEVR